MCIVFFGVNLEHFFNEKKTKIREHGLTMISIDLERHVTQDIEKKKLDKIKMPNTCCCSFDFFFSKFFFIEKKDKNISFQYLKLNLKGESVEKIGLSYCVFAV